MLLYYYFFQITKFIILHCLKNFNVKYAKICLFFGKHPFLFSPKIHKKLRLKKGPKNFWITQDAPLPHVLAQT